jgi:F0F1-type ATP synthase delta subunit
MHMFHTATRRAAVILTSLLIAAPAVHAGPIDLLVEAVTPGTTTVIRHSSGDYHFSWRIKGNLVLTDALDDVARVSKRAVVEESSGGIKRRMLFVADANGGVARSYFLNNKSAAIDADAKQWLARVISQMVREGAFQNEKRVAHLLKNGGADAVIAEIEQIKSGYSRKTYTQNLLAQTALSEPQFDRVLKTLRPKDSAFETRETLVALIGKRTLNAAQQTSVLESVAAMNGAFEQRGVMSALAPTLLPAPSVAAAWRAAIAKMDSDFEVRTVIEELMKSPNGAQHVMLSLQSAEALKGNFERMSALNATLAHMRKPDAAQLAAYLAIVNKIDGAFERQNVLVDLVNRAALDKAGYAAVLQSTEGMRGDFEIKNVLSAVAKKIPADGELVSRYRKIARNLGDFERGQAEKAIDHSNL